MAETTDKKKKDKRSAGNEEVQVETGAIEEIDEVEGFSREEVARLLKVKRGVAQGKYSDVTDEHKKLLFVQWLIEHNKLNS